MAFLLAKLCKNKIHSLLLPDMQEKNPKADLITILGPTASGKTPVATALAYELETEVISADSRQVYKRMDLGTGKDLEDYTINGKKINYHLIDIVEPGTKYNIFEYQRDFLEVYGKMRQKELTPIVCGGSGLYIESVLRGYRLFPVPENKEMRTRLENKSLEELTEMLAAYKELHNSTDVDTPKRAIRALEIEEYYAHIPIERRSFPNINSINIGIDVSREVRRERISKRLRQRLKDGMVEEVEALLHSGISAEDLIYYGLEYKFITLYIIGKLSYEEMLHSLEIAIHQFAKRQMTWFRGMERRGIKIHWIDGMLHTEEKVQQIKDLL